jgi:hypothetical protein
MDRHVMDASALRRAPTALARDDFIDIRHLREGADHDGLNEAPCANGIRQFLQMFFIEMFAGIARVRAQELDRDLPLGRAGHIWARDIGAGVANERGKAPAEARAVFVCHGVFRSMALSGERKS